MSHPSDPSSSDFPAADHNDEALNATLALAREYRPEIIARSEFGFGTRLSAQLAELRRQGVAPGSTLWDEALAWLWGGAVGVAPVVAGLAVWFFIANGLNIQLDSNFDSLFHHLTSYLPFDSGN